MSVLWPIWILCWKKFCRVFPSGGDHERRKYIAEKLKDSAVGQVEGRRPKCNQGDKQLRISLIAALGGALGRTSEPFEETHR